MSVLHELFRASAARWPDRVAVGDGTRSLTYAELDRASNRLAHRLRRAGAGPEVLVGLCLDRTVELVVALLGILKTGAGYLPLDPRYPKARLEQVLADSGCALIVDDLRLDEDDTPFATDVRPGNVAYVIYTSGSTGRPKGVVVTHANVTRLFGVTEHEFGFAEDDVWTMFHSVAFDFSVWEMWGALLYGGRLVVVPYAVSRDPEAFVRLLCDERVTMLSQTPSALRQLARAAEQAGYPELALRWIVFGGEKLEPHILGRWIERYGDARPRLANMYGITETTVHVTLRRVTAADVAARESPIGEPLRDLRVHLLDEHMRPVEPGAVGELYVGGAGVSRGYLGRPDLTAQRFVPDPFGPPGSRLYRTGDLGRLDERLGLVFDGRADSQVQLRGFRIELGEIEATVLAHPAVREVAVVLRDDRLVCYWAGLPGVQSGLREWVAERLPDYMVPSAFVAMDALPMTDNGKLDRNALPEPVVVATPAIDGPRDHVEEQLVKIWSGLLSLETVGVHENFFSLGGDSMLALPMVAEAKAAGLPLTVVTLFAHPTIAELAHWCRSQLGAQAEAAQAEEALADRPAEEPMYPASALQQGIIFHTKLAGDPTLYHDLVAARVRARLDLGALRRVLDELSARHEILRTSFDLGTRREITQVVHASAPIPLTVVAGEQGGIPEWWRTQWREGFHLDRAPLVRCHVLTGGGPDEFWLAVSAHHAVLDGWSFSLLVTELLTAYDRELGGGSGMRVQAGPPVSYREFVALERRETADGAAQRFWLDYLFGVEPLRLPAARADAASAEPRLEPDVHVILPRELVEGVQRTATAMGVPVKSVYLAAHLAALATVCERTDVITGVVVNGRPEVATADETLGLFLNTIPVRVDTGGLSLVDLVRACLASERLVAEHRRFPLARLRKAFGSVPFDVLFNFTSFRMMDALHKLAHVEIREWWQCDRNSFPVTVEIGQLFASDDWELALRVDPRRVDPVFGEALAGVLQAVLWKIVSHQTGDLR